MGCILLPAPQQRVGKRGGEMTDDRESFIDGVRAISESVYSFHERFGIGSVDTSESG